MRISTRRIFPGGFQGPCTNQECSYRLSHLGAFYSQIQQVQLLKRSTRGRSPDRFGLRTPPILSGTLCIAATVVVTVMDLAGRSCPTVGYRPCIRDSIDYLALRSVCSTVLRTVLTKKATRKTLNPPGPLSRRSSLRSSGVRGFKGTEYMCTEARVPLIVPPPNKQRRRGSSHNNRRHRSFLIDRQMARRTSRTRS